MRVLFCSFDSPGYLYPLVGLALELRSHGHQVAFATNPAALPTLDAAGIERIPRGSTEGPSYRVHLHHVAVPIAIDVKHAEFATERFAPDVVVTHPLCHGPLLARERGGAPVAVLGLFSWLWPVAGRGARGRGEAELRRLRSWRLASTVEIANRGRALFRLPALETDEGRNPFTGDLHLLRNVPALLPELGRMPPQVHAVGACAWTPPASTDAAWDELRRSFAEPEAPLLYVQHGRTFGGPGFWTQLVEALADQPVQVAASVGRMDQEMGTLPRNFLVRDHVPQEVVMPHARAVVANGHSSVVLGACTNGLPMVLVPGGVETPDNAHLLERAGCARVLEPQGLTAGALAEAVRDAMDDPALRGRSRAVRRAFARIDSFAVAAGLVESLGATGAPPLRAAERELVAGAA